MSDYSLEIEVLDRLESARQIIELMLAGHANLDSDTLGHLGHMLTASAQKLSWAQNEPSLFGDDRD